MSDQPRILFCCFDVVPAPHALSRRLTEYVKGLGDRYQVVVLSNKTPDHSHIERYHGARLLRVPVGNGDYPARAQAFDRAVRRQIESEEYVLVHFFDPFGGYALCERRAEFGYKLVYDAAVFPSVDLPFQQTQVAQNRRFLAKVRRQELFCLMNADTVLVSSQVTQDYVASLGVGREHVRVVRAPVNREPYTRELMGRPDATPMKLIHLGSLVGYHDLEVLLEAMSLALQTVDVRLVIVSPKTPEHTARVQEKVNALKLAGKVELQDPVVHDDVHKILAVADVGLLTLSDSERARKVGSPVARAGEYLAGGRPIIAADLPVTREVVPAEAGVFYTPSDARSLADAIVSLASDPKRRVALGEAARAASESWDSAQVAKKLMGVYAKLTGMEPVPEQTAAAPDQVTQLGKVSSEDSNASTQVGGRPPGLEDSRPGTGKAKRPDTNTDPAAAGNDRPAVLGTLIREDATPIRGAADPSGNTDPMAARSAPVIMGEPLHDGSIPQTAPRPGPPVPDETPLSPAVPALLRPASVPAGGPASPPNPRTGAVRAPVSATGKTQPALPVAPPPPDVPGAPPVAVPMAVAVGPATSTPSAAAPSAAAPSTAAPSAAAPSTAAPSAAAPSAAAPSAAAPSTAAPSAAAPSAATPSAAAPSGASAAATDPAATGPTGEPRGAPPTNAPSTTAEPNGQGAATQRPATPVPGSPPGPRAARSPGSGAKKAAAPVPSASPAGSGPPPLPASSRAARRATAATSPEPAGGTPSPAAPSAPTVEAAVTAPQPHAAAPARPPRPVAPPGALAVDDIEEDEPTPAAPIQLSALVPKVTATTSESLVPVRGEEPSGVAHVADSEVEEVSAGDVLDAGDEPAVVNDNDIHAIDDEHTVVPDEVPETDDVAEAGQSGVHVAASALEPWFAQLVHGYCPPVADLFNRHTPPTTMPGRDT